MIPIAAPASEDVPDIPMHGAAKAVCVSHPACSRLTLTAVSEAHRVRRSKIIDLAKEERMLPTQRVEGLQWPMQPAIRQDQAVTGQRDEAVRTAFAAFDMPVHLTGRPPGDVHDEGVNVSAIDDYLKCIFGLPHHAGLIGRHVARYIAGLDTIESSTPHALSASRLTALAAFYISLCQGCAFNASGDFDTTGLVDFVAARIGMPKDALEQDLINSPLGAYVFMGMKLNSGAHKLSIYDAHTQALPAPSPSLRFDDADNGAIENGYLRNVTISEQTLHATNLASVDLSGAYINNCFFIDILFSSTNLYNVIFNEIFFSQCKFVDANLAYATFRNARLSDNEFRQCKMDAIRFHATALNRTRFEECVLRNMTFDNEGHFDASTAIGIEKTMIHACDLSGATLRDVRCNGGGLTDCVLWEATITDSVFTHSTWRHPIMILPKSPFFGAKFDNLQFEDCAMKQLNADESQWANCSFKRGDLTDASWRHGVLRTMRFLSVEMPRVRFDHAVCQGLRIEALCDLDEVSFVNATMTKVRFDRGPGTSLFRLKDANFSAATLFDVSFQRCQLIHAKFISTQLIGVGFSRCNLNYADFTRSAGADLLDMLKFNHMKHYRTEGISTKDGDIGSMGSEKGRALLLNHFNYNYCFLSNILAGSRGELTASLVLRIADNLLHDENDPMDTDAWMISALSEAYANIPFDMDTRMQIDVHLMRMLERNLTSLNDPEWRTRPENKWAPDAFEHLRRLLRNQVQPAVSL